MSRKNVPGERAIEDGVIVRRKSRTVGRKTRRKTSSSCTPASMRQMSALGERIRLRRDRFCSSTEIRSRRRRPGVAVPKMYSPLRPQQCLEKRGTRHRRSIDVEPDDVDDAGAAAGGVVAGDFEAADRGQRRRMAWTATLGRHWRRPSPSCCWDYRTTRLTLKLATIRLRHHRSSLAVDAVGDIDWQPRRPAPSTMPGLVVRRMEGDVFQAHHHQD